MVVDDRTTVEQADFFAQPFHDSRSACVHRAGASPELFRDAFDRLLLDRRQPKRHPRCVGEFAADPLGRPAKNFTLAIGVQRTIKCGMLIFVDQAGQLVLHFGQSAALFAGTASMLVDDGRANDLSQPRAKLGMAGIVVEALDVLADSNQHFLPEISGVGGLHPESNRDALDHAAIDVLKMPPRVAIGVIAKANQNARSCVGNGQFRLDCCVITDTSRLHATEQPDLSEKFRNCAPRPSLVTARPRLIRLADANAAL